MFYLTSKFHDNRVNTFGFMEGFFYKPPPPPPSQAQELLKSPSMTFFDKGVESDPDKDFFKKIFNVTNVSNVRNLYLDQIKPLYQRIKQYCNQI